MKKPFKKIFFLLFLMMGASHAEDNLENLEAYPKSNSSDTAQIKSLSDLQQITPASSISVIQRRYLPKTFRWELNASLSGTINHTFFYLGGVSGRIGLFLREDHGLGLEGFATLPPIFKVVTNNMIGPPNYILPSSSILPQFYGGIYYKWSPIFGKFALLDKKIIYFDAYITIGGGIHKVLNGVETIKEQIKKKGLTPKKNKPHSKLVGQAFPAFTLGVGQLFALSQSLAVNWELKWFYTYSKYEKRLEDKEERIYIPTDLNFSLGLNYYFPEAGYR